MRALCSTFLGSVLTRCRQDEADSDCAEAPTSVAEDEPKDAAWSDSSVIYHDIGNFS